MSPKNRYQLAVLAPLGVFVATLPVNLALHQPLITFIPTLATLFWSSRQLEAIRCPQCDTPVRQGRFFLFGLDRCKHCGAGLS
ncbi:hypothetical protein MIT9_P2551 [Methylomarinovum caldicuralii]|uniref:Uncharacterized protein n=1 Tax=Methylomarinovum caldicuralii TaxID=438856 RepID=A0AAU9C2I0_9GAMM|nr:hypothetical protein [Methylomarinovum caldicuralii]BCX82960.1 hypothetical protein MIT9_P2551 [Methylomarinovum caldicuralii]